MGISVWFEDKVVVVRGGMGGRCERRGRAAKAKLQRRKRRKHRQGHAELCLAVQCGSREAREGVVVARRGVRIGMGRVARSLRGETVYTGLFPGRLRKSRDLGGALRPMLRYSSSRFYGGEGLLGHGELAVA